MQTTAVPPDEAPTTAPDMMPKTFWIACVCIAATRVVAS